MSASIQSWSNTRAQPMPDWVKAVMVGEVEPNGSFLIGTPCGHARVHPGYVVLNRRGAFYTRDASEVRELLSELDEAEKPAPPKPAPKRQSTKPSKGASIATSPSRPKRSYCKWTPPKGMPPSIEMRHPDELLIDETYQRSIDTNPSRRLIHAIAANWDWRLCVPLMVSRRADGLFVIDGQHRLSAAKMRGDIPFLPCCISTYDSPAAEAEMFVAANRSRRAVNHLDDFHAAIVANNDDAIEINNIVVGAGLRVSRKTGKASWVPGEVTFTAAISKILRRHGETLPSWALAIIATEFAGQVLSNGSSVFTALCSLRINPPDAGIDEARLRRALRAYDMKGWGTFLNGCKGGDDRRRAMREAILMAYADAPEADHNSEVDE